MYITLKKKKKNPNKIYSWFLNNHKGQKKIKYPQNDKMNYNYKCTKEKIYIYTDIKVAVQKSFLTSHQRGKSWKKSKRNISDHIKTKNI